MPLSFAAASSKLPESFNPAGDTPDPELDQPGAEVDDPDDSLGFADRVTAPRPRVSEPCPSRGGSCGRGCPRGAVDGPPRAGTSPCHVFCARPLADPVPGV